MGRALPGQTVGEGGAQGPGGAGLLSGPGDQCTPHPRQAGRGLPLGPALPAWVIRRTAPDVSSLHSFHWRLPGEGPGYALRSPQPPEDRNFPSNTGSPPPGLRRLRSGKSEFSHSDRHLGFSAWRGGAG